MLSNSFPVISASSFLISEYIPIAAHALFFIFTYTDEAGSSPTSIVTNPGGFFPSLTIFEISVLSSSLISDAVFFPSIIFIFTKVFLQFLILINYHLLLSRLHY